MLLAASMGLLTPPTPRHARALPPRLHGGTPPATSDDPEPDRLLALLLLAADGVGAFARSRLDETTPPPTGGGEEQLRRAWDQRFAERQRARAAEAKAAAAARRPWPSRLDDPQWSRAFVSAAAAAAAEAAPPPAARPPSLATAAATAAALALQAVEMAAVAVIHRLPREEAAVQRKRTVEEEEAWRRRWRGGVAEDDAVWRHVEERAPSGGWAPTLGEVAAVSAATMMLMVEASAVAVIKMSANATRDQAPE
ncbi:hypothetical protein AB1Y20_005483 [Prymnesium parvum]|uniref:Uncharacterized protein n=1 Tax=Prymnesium parvum TaxID=97485 RepID=A0AB34J5X7_PRYPA